MYIAYKVNKLLKSKAHESDWPVIFKFGTRPILI